MIYVSLPEKFESESRRLGFYLAMEEYVATHRDEKELFFMWQVNPTVICGRNQNVEEETDIEYCRREHIDIVRRKSGGGCVFADRNNVMFSYISKSTDVRTTFSDYTGRVAEMLRNLGLDASDNSRNDILIGDRKVSGCAFYHLPGRSIVHGTMLYDTDGIHISKALTPSKAKLRSKGVKSVPSRITTVKEHLPQLSLSDFKSHSRLSLCGKSNITLMAEDIRVIEEMEKSYYLKEWTFRNVERHRSNRRKHIAGVGEMNVSFSTDAEGRIRDIDINGDFFHLADFEKLKELLKGVEVSQDALKKALKHEDMSKIIVGLKNDEIVELIAGSN